MKNFLFGGIILPTTTVLLVILLVPISFVALLLEQLHRGVSIVALVLGEWINSNTQASNEIKKKLMKELEGEEVWEGEDAWKGEDA